MLQTLKNLEARESSFFDSCHIKNERISDQLIKDLIFSDCVFEKVEFENCTIQNCTFWQGRWNKVTLVNCQIIDCNFHAKVVIDHLQIQNSIIKGTLFNATTFNHSTCNHSELSNFCRFHYCTFNKFQINHSQLNSVNFSDCRMNYCIFDHCHFQTCDFGKSAMQFTQFFNCQGSHLSFYRTDLSGTVFKHSNFEHLNLREVTPPSIDLKQFKNGKIAQATLTEKMAWQSTPGLLPEDLKTSE
ncbi:MAG: hypothetical protein EBX40_00740 [Gammaproteobacteria bacterium]|nr:hypothetical protein [Gammaproteobacteria bacterium]